MEDFTPSKNYFAMWRVAKKIENLDSMDLIFNSLCAEIGYKDPDQDSAQAEAGKKSAEAKNSRDRGEGGRKV